jgi:hypothetical protein
LAERGTEGGPGHSIGQGRVTRYAKGSMISGGDRPLRPPGLPIVEVCGCGFWIPGARNFGCSVRTGRHHSSREQGQEKACSLHACFHRDVISPLPQASRQTSCGARGRNNRSHANEFPRSAQRTVAVDTGIQKISSFETPALRQPRARLIARWNPGRQLSTWTITIADVRDELRESSLPWTQ